MPVSEEESAVWTRVDGIWETGIDLLSARFVGHRYAPHLHDEYSIGVCTGGAERIDYRGASHIAVPGTVALLEPGEPHTGEAAASGGWSYDAAYVPPELFGDGPPHFPQPVVTDPDAARMLGAAYRALMRGADPLEGETRLLLALDTVVCRYAVGVTAAERRLGGRLVATVMASLGDRIVAPPSLAEIAGEVGLSRYQVVRAFREAVGMPPYAWLAQHRVRRARTLLLAGHRPADVAGLVGFADQAHLTRWFRRVMGVTPAVYRNSVQDIGRASG
ncbi:helix-turn-helix transcriptional regulator [Phytohabitans aurantiacus]|uniref:AraC family transcriptional regulator n=1 Tax=Phytohabitans aurantiacus TaxID=3016789 RepID=A0ABQ5R6U3_9ACTN|nr:AraC family transcriptional regulator [Phytohabitans aurantiacus]GLI02479.1 AraC family transcriptional regulator [Phytohabitans aurantiacus]